jgi:D-alanine-D-alanine ligase
MHLETRSQSRPRFKPAVLFFDDFGYEQFDQLAGSLRRRGIAAIRLLAPASAARRVPQTLSRRLRDRWIYAGRVQLDDPVAWRLLGEGRLGRFEVVDALLAETAVAMVGIGSPVIRQLSARALAFSGQSPDRLLDKFEVNVLMAQAGLPVPPQIAATAMTASAAAAVLGLPIAVKARLGLGGDGVVIARSIEAMERARQRLDPAGDGGLFYQAYVAGVSVGYGCVQGPDGPLLEHGFRVERRQWDLGPSAEVSIDDDPRLREAGRRAVAALGCRGFAQIDFIRDAEGKLWPLDANLRPWGNVLSMLCLDIDFVDAYAALLSGRPCPPRAPPAAAGQLQPVFPFALHEAASSGSLGLIAARSRSFAGMCRRGPGAPYGLMVAAKVGSLLLQRLARTLAGRVVGPAHLMDVARRELP